VCLLIFDMSVYEEEPRQDPIAIWFHEYQLDHRYDAQSNHGIFHDNHKSPKGNPWIASSKKAVNNEELDWTKEIEVFLWPDGRALLDRCDKSTK
jgi:hypothetical protein